MEDAKLLEKVINLYGKLYEKDEMFLLGYLMGCGGQVMLIDGMEHDIMLLKHDSDFWINIVEDCLKTRKKVVNENIEEAKELLRKKLEERNAHIPSWLR